MEHKKTYPNFVAIEWSFNCGLDLHVLAIQKVICQARRWHLVQRTFAVYSTHAIANDAVFVPSMRYTDLHSQVLPSSDLATLCEASPATLALIRISLQSVPLPGAPVSVTVLCRIAGAHGQRSPSLELINGRVIQTRSRVDPRSRLPAHRLEMVLGGLMWARRATAY